MDSFDILEGFLNTEIENTNSFEHQEMYQAILYFLTSYEIREGKFEGNSYLINKLNRETVILYQEDETPNGWVYSQNARIMHIPILLKEIDKRAQLAGLKKVED